MNFRVIFFMTLYVSSFICTMDGNSQNRLWAVRVEQAIQDKLRFDIFYCENSKQYKEDQKLLKSLQKTEKFILEKMNFLNKVKADDFVEIITSIVDLRTSGPLNVNHIGSSSYAKEQQLKNESIILKQGAIVLLQQAKCARDKSKTSAFLSVLKNK